MIGPYPNLRPSWLKRVAKSVVSSTMAVAGELQHFATITQSLSKPEVAQLKLLTEAGKSVLRVEVQSLLDDYPTRSPIPQPCLGHDSAGVHGPTLIPDGALWRRPQTQDHTQRSSTTRVWQNDGSAAGLFHEAHPCPVVQGQGGHRDLPPDTRKRRDSPVS